jgi:hypothetical protein
LAKTPVRRTFPRRLCEVDPPLNDAFWAIRARPLFRPVAAGQLLDDPDRLVVSERLEVVASGPAAFGSGGVHRRRCRDVILRLARRNLGGQHKLSENLRVVGTDNEA